MKICTTATGVEHHMTKTGKWTCCGHLVADPVDPRNLSPQTYMQVTCLMCRDAVREEIQRLQDLLVVKPVEVAA